MRSVNNRRSKRQPSSVKKLTVRIGGTNGTILVFRDRLALALLFLIEADKAGFAPSYWPHEKWSQCILTLRQEGIGIETLLERTDGLRGRYVLRCPVKIIDREDYE